MVTVTAAAEGLGAFTQDFVYERRIGSRNQIEVKVPITFLERGSGSWRGGVGDVAIGFKRNLFHSLNTGSIFSLTGEVVLPTGNADKGFGKGVTVFEPFVTFGQILPGAGFLHFQGGLEAPADRDLADEAFWRTAIGRTFAADRGFGRAWFPHKCIACHNGMITSVGEDVSIGFAWRASMMANSARDPYWHAGVRREVMDHPESQVAIEDECSKCHMPMARYLAHETGGTGQVFEHLPVGSGGDPWTCSRPMASPAPFVTRSRPKASALLKAWWGSSKSIEPPETETGRSTGLSRWTNPGWH